MLRSIPVLALLVAQVALAVESSDAASADSILLNGRILVFSGPERHERASAPRFEQAIAIRDGRIAFVGTSEEARKRAGPATRVTDLQARLAGASGAERAALNARLAEVQSAVRSEKLGEVAAEFDAVHSVGRAQAVGSVHRIIPAAALRPELIAAVARGVARVDARGAAS